jgi:hypothetical protein
LLSLSLFSFIAYVRVERLIGRAQFLPSEYIFDRARITDKAKKGLIAGAEFASSASWKYFSKSVLLQ